MQRRAVALQSTSSSSSPRATTTAMPWSPSGPDQHAVAWSHYVGREAHAVGDDADAGGGDVEPVRLAALDDLVSPVATGTPAAAAARAIDAAMRRRSATANPSSTTKPAESATGCAPATARSLTVPLTASSPMSPPGKKIGLTTYESVVKASRRPVQVEHCRVTERREQRIAELLQEQAFDERPRRLAAPAVGERDELVAKLRPPAPHAGTRSRRRASRP